MYSDVNVKVVADQATTDMTDMTDTTTTTTPINNNKYDLHRKPNKTTATTTTDMTTLTTMTLTENKDNLLRHFLKSKNISQATREIGLNLTTAQSMVEYKGRGTGLVPEGLIELHSGEKGVKHYIIKEAEEILNEE